MKTNPFSSISELEKKLAAQAKTIQVLMDTVEAQSSSGISSLDLLSQNLNLERIVELKTEHLRQQGEELHNALVELKSTQAHLVQANKLESVGQLAAGIAHEINTPIQFIGSNIEFLAQSFRQADSLISETLELLRQSDSPNACSIALQKIVQRAEEFDWEYLHEEIPSAIEQSQEGIKRIITIVQAMKEFSHPSSKEKVKYNINKLLETTIIVASNEWKYIAEVETQLQSDLPLVSCLADELNQVFLNILVNATHAIEQKNKGLQEKVKGKIIISTRSMEPYIEVRISDTGTGIPDEIRNRIFDPFFTTKTVGKGTGQGLAIAHDVIIKKHDGAIDLESEYGVGSTFIIRLPID